MTAELGTMLGLSIPVVLSVIGVERSVERLQADIDRLRDDMDRLRNDVNAILVRLPAKVE